MKIKIPFHKTIVPQTLKDSLVSSIDTGSFSSVEQLERGVAESTGFSHALATSSSTAALHLAMCALDLKRGDKVLCAINSFVDVPEVVRHFDAEPIFVDTLPGTHVIDPRKLSEAAETVKGKKLRAVIVTHPAGYPVPLEAIRDVADTYGLKVVEDATERTRIQARERGSDLTVMGLGSKWDNTMDGGVLLTQDSAYAQRAGLVRNHGMVATSPETPTLYDVQEIGCQYRMQEFAGLYAQALHDEASKHFARRQAIAAAYFDALSDLGNVALPPRESDHDYTQFLIAIGTNRDAFARKLKEAGIETGLYNIPLNFTRYYKEKYGLKVFDFPVALEAYQTSLSLPIYPQMTDGDVRYVVETIRSIAQSHR